MNYRGFDRSRGADRGGGDRRYERPSSAAGGERSERGSGGRGGDRERRDRSRDR